MVEPNKTTVSDNTENGAHNMVKLTIDNCEVVVPEHTTILDAAMSVGIQIPTLCYLRDLNEIGGCRVCVVEVEGCDQLVAACNNYVLDGMVVHTNSPKAREARRTNVQLLLSQHDSQCTSCVRSGNCNLQTIANDLGIFYLPYRRHLAGEGWDFDFPIIRENDKCIKCMRCIKVCESVQGLGIWDLTNRATHTAVGTRGRVPIGKTDCVACGQCITHCPTGALRERDDTQKAYAALGDPDRVTIVQIAPAVRAAWGEAFGMPTGKATVGQLVSVLRKLGADYVFDTTFSADLTIMEEGTELLQRLQAGDLDNQPMFTSCCPGWVRFLKSQFPEMTGRLSTAKSPQQMFGAVGKTWLAHNLGVDADKIYSISIMPCIAKKAERELPSMDSAGHGSDVDLVITTRELARMARAEHLDVENIAESAFDSPLGDGTGAGVIFGATGGVMEAALRSAYFLTTGENPSPDAFREVRDDGTISPLPWREATFELAGRTVRCAVASGLGNARQLLHSLQRREVHYEFVEIMACPGGCAGGGGQPVDGTDREKAADRGKVLFRLDQNAPLRFSHENPAVQALYREYLDEPCSHRAEELLHCDHFAWQMNASR